MHLESNVFDVRPPILVDPSILQPELLNSVTVQGFGFYLDDSNLSVGHLQNVDTDVFEA